MQSYGSFNQLVQGNGLPDYKGSSVNPNKYIENWNENNPDHAMPLKEQQHELSTKDESYKETTWWKEQQERERFFEANEEGAG